MPTITVLPHETLCPKGLSFESATGAILCDELLAHDIAIEHACDRSCACTTCHVVLKTGMSSMNEAEEREDDLLDRAWGLEATSRLSCQVKIGTAPITLFIPKYTINHARE
jgi:ferredoxin, 2Fe-2S